jgi:hypothetical protein
VNARALEGSRVNAVLLALGCALCLAWAWTPWTGIAGALAAALLPWLARRSGGFKQYAPWASVYAALLVFAVPPYTFESIVSERFTAFLSTLALAYLIGAAFDGVEGRSAWAWLAPLLTVVAFPTPLGLAGGLGLAILGRVGTPLLLALHQPKAALGAVALLVGAVALLSLALPAPRSWSESWTTMTNSSTGLSPAGQMAVELIQPPKPTQAQNTRRPQPGPKLAQNDWVFVFLNLLLLVGVLGIVVFSILLLRRPARPGGKDLRRQWWDLVPVVALIALMLVLIVWNGTTQNPSGGASVGQSASSVSDTPSADNRVRRVQPSEDAPSEPSRPSGVTPWIVLLGFLAVAYLLWRLRSHALDAEPSAALEPDAPLTASQEAANEVRRCYQRFLILARDTGTPKAPSETPLEFADRVGDVHPEARAAAGQLTQLYEPVRYGTLAAATHALEAQSALRTLEQSLTVAHIPRNTPEANNQELR